MVLRYKALSGSKTSNNSSSISIDQLDLIEEVIMTSLNSRLTVPTAIEYILILLFLANNTFDFSKVKVKVRIYIVFCVAHEELRKYPQSTIGLACLLTTLKEL
jgi:hypothetical protein